MFGFFRSGKKNKIGQIALGHCQDIEPHEIFYDSLAKKHEESLNISEKKFQIALPRFSLRLPLVITGIFFVITMVRVAQLQAFEGIEYNRQAEQNKYLFYKVQSNRGIIYDRDFKPLVQNLSTFDLECDISQMPRAENDRQKMISNIAAIIGKDASALSKSIEKKEIPTVENLQHQPLIVLEARIADFPGCFITKRPIRGYVSQAGLSHVLGYMGKIEPDEWKADPGNYSVNDYVGRAGLEKSYEKVLRKNPGKLRIERDAKGNIISSDVAAAPQSGDNLQLWLDYGLQEKLAAALKDQLADLGLKKGSAVALDPKTGGVLAMVSYPGFDNNAFSSGNSEDIQKLFSDKDTPLLARPIQGQYLTGSTIKPFEAAAALEEKIIKADKDIDCQGKLVIPNRYNPEIVYTFNDNHTHGLTDMYKALAESCNVYFWTIGGGFGNQSGLGPTRIKKYLELFGWGAATGIDLPGESAGFIPTPEWKKERFKNTQDQNWGDGDTYNLAIGQGFIGITPLQVAAAFVAIANGGTLYQPQMVHNILDSSRNLVKENLPRVIRQNFVDAKNIQAVREGMRHGVNGVNAPLASSLILNSLPVQAAAKTGTAQLRKAADGKDLMNSWVSVFAPYDDPQIVITIMMEEVHEGQFAVLPVAKDVLGWYFGGRDSALENNGAKYDNQTTAISDDTANNNALDPSPANHLNSTAPANSSPAITPQTITLPAATTTPPRIN